MSHISRIRKTIGNPESRVQRPQSRRQSLASKRPDILVPTVRKTIKAQDWLDREFREGGFLRRYLNNEVGRMPQLLRQVARTRHGFQQNNRSDLRLLATLPARLYQRLKAMDPHFFDDNQNLKSLRRDNADACVYV